MAKRSRNTVKRKRRRLIFGIELVVLLVLVGVLFVYANITNKLGKIDTSDSADSADVKVNEQVVGSKVMKGYTNIALFGVDSRDENLDSSNSDTTIVASINNDTKEVRLVSIYRDTYLNIGQDKDKYDKANAAYAIGGPVQAMSMLNTNLDLNIRNYVSVDFNALVKVIDLLGGLDVDLSYEEIEHMNNYCVETSEKTGASYEPIEKPDPKPENEAEILGTYHLNGVQATSYCRIRYTSGWDMKRTERQRYIISLMVEKAKKASLSTLNDIMDEVFPMIKTNFTKTELIQLGMGILSYQLGDTQGFPKSNIMGEEVKNAIGLDCVVPTTLEANVKQLHAFLFDQEDYKPSETVLKRSDYIAAHTGFGNDYVSDELKQYISDRASTLDDESDTEEETDTQSDTNSKTSVSDETPAYSRDSSYSDNDSSYDNYSNSNSNYNSNYDDSNYDDSNYDDSDDDYDYEDNSDSYSGYGNNNGYYNNYNEDNGGNDESGSTNSGESDYSDSSYSDNTYSEGEE